MKTNTKKCCDHHGEKHRGKVVGCPTNGAAVTNAVFPAIEFSQIPNIHFS